MKLAALLALVAVSAQAQAPAPVVEYVVVPAQVLEQMMHTHEEFRALQKKIYELQRGTNCV